MCGIVGATAERQIEAILVEGLKRLEYRGYDSAGVAIINPKTHEIERKRAHGKVDLLEKALREKPLTGHTGIAHTRWATHGKPSEANAHPHSSHDTISIVHNGIIENHQQLRAQLIEKNYTFESETDSEVIAHLIHFHFLKTNDMMQTLHDVSHELKGAYSLGILSQKTPDKLYGIRSGSPLVIGVGIGENFIASDPLALLPVTQKFIYLEEGDIVAISRDQILIHNQEGQTVTRDIRECTTDGDAASKGNFRHYMLKEIYDQPDALKEMVKHGIQHHQLTNIFQHANNTILACVQRVHIVACGTSFHAGLIARYWIESIARIPAQVEIASEFRYRDSMMEPNTLFIAISQSGETADTLAAARHAKHMGCKTILAICNAVESTLVRESDLLLLTRSGKEVGVAATKTFTTQLTGLALFTLALAEQHTALATSLASHIEALESLPTIINELLNLDILTQSIGKLFMQKNHALFIARGEFYPIALEGALKLKEISYVHAEGYPAGELKHGPLALVDENMPVIVIAPQNALFEKIASNIQEVQARGGQVFVLSDAPASAFGNHVVHIPMPSMPDFIAPIAYTIPLQLLSYHIAVLRGTDVDQPRNLAKSVTVE
ncbi:MAG: glutamine--fructose-6-phosphate transaminase (isomerizing) [Coxiellaceae bacterium]|nr:glutamine--fructose-6-phosphate transaminase (isomerizing) [Coxiellaceae bacterium]